MNNVSTDTQEKPVLNSSPDGRLGIVPLLSTMEIGQKINDHLVGWRKKRVEDECDDPSLTPKERKRCLMKRK